MARVMMNYGNRRYLALAAMLQEACRPLGMMWWTIKAVFVRPRPHTISCECVMNGCLPSVKDSFASATRYVTQSILIVLGALKK
jgi:hypothetical protein